MHVRPQARRPNVYTYESKQSYQVNSHMPK